MIFFLCKESKCKKTIFGGGWGEGGGGARVSEFIFTKNPNVKYFLGGGGGRVGVGLSKCFFFTMNPSLRYFLLRGRREGVGARVSEFF